MKRLGMVGQLVFGIIFLSGGAAEVGAKQYYSCPQNEAEITKKVLEENPKSQPPSSPSCKNCHGCTGLSSGQVYVCDYVSGGEVGLGLPPIKGGGNYCTPLFYKENDDDQWVYNTGWPGYCDGC